MKINFTKKQFETLMKIVYIGNWVVNGVRSGSDDDPHIKEYKDLEKYVYSFAKDFSFEDLLDLSDGDIYPSREFEEGEVRELIDYYNEDTFWEELSSRLAMRDFYRDYGDEEIKKMTLEERIRKDHPYMEKYWDEIDNHGIQRLEIAKQ